jgi:hypothetical protein
MWRAAAAAADVPVTFCSTESLSAPQTPPLPPHPALVVVDEAHHFRTRGTRRRRRLAPVCARSRTLLLTATPLHNGAGDLVALLALFLGERAHTLDAPTLAALVVRRRHTDLRRIARAGERGTLAARPSPTSPVPGGTISPPPPASAVRCSPCRHRSRLPVAPRPRRSPP